MIALLPCGRALQCDACFIGPGDCRFEAKPLTAAQRESWSLTPRGAFEAGWPAALEAEKEKMAAKTNAERQAELKARRIAAGLVPVTNLWAHKQDVVPIREHAAKLARRRERSERLKPPKK